MSDVARQAEKHQSLASASLAESGKQPTIKLTTRTDRSIPMFLLQHFAKPLSTMIVTLPKKPTPAGSMQLKPSRKALKTCEITERVVEDIHIYDFAQKQTHAEESEKPRAAPKKRLYYFAGGGWQMPPTNEHWKLFAEYTAKIPEMAFALVSYPLAPKNAAPVSFPQLMKLYRKLMADAHDAGEKVLLGGDSAGGNIVLALTLSALTEDSKSVCPSALLVMSPSTDLTRSNPDMKVLEKNDPLLRLSFVVETAEAWRADWDAHDIRVSPLYADLSILAQRGVGVYGLTGGYDILGPDGVLFRKKCNEAGVEGEWLHWEKQMHCWPLAFSFRLPESVAAKEWIVDVLQRA